MGWFVPRFGRKTLPPESLSPPDRADLELLDELKVEGSNLRLPHPVRAFLRFETEAGARGAMEMVDQEGYRSFLRADPTGCWTVTAITTMVPTPGAITRMRETLSALATTGGGEYVGWQSPPVY
ncbi:MAG: ribonuclease E inhibitor RraB [Chloroflexota bacterium]